MSIAGFRSSRATTASTSKSDKTNNNPIETKTLGTF